METRSLSVRRRAGRWTRGVLAGGIAAGGGYVVLVAAAPNVERFTVELAVVCVAIAVASWALVARASRVAPSRPAMRASVAASVVFTAGAMLLAPLPWWELTAGSTAAAARAVTGDGPGGGPEIREVLVTASPLFVGRWLSTLHDGGRVRHGRGEFGSSDPAVVRATIVAQAIVAGLRADGEQSAVVTGGVLVVTGDATVANHHSDRLEAGDVLVDVAGSPVRSFEEFLAVLANLDGPVTVRFGRGGTVVSGQGS